MSITELSIKRPILFIVFYLVLVGFGYISYTNLKYELLPSLATPFVTVIAQYPGASPAEVENTVTKKIEEGVSAVNKIKKITANSSEGVSVVTIEFTADANADVAAQDVQRAVSAIGAQLPAAVKMPAIEKLNVNDLPVLRLGVTATVEEEALYQLVDKRIKPRLAQIKSVGRVVTMGGTEQEIKVFIDGNKLHYYNISAMEVVDALARANVDVPIGSIKDEDATLGVRISGKIRGLDQIRHQIVRKIENGSAVRIEDVARVETGKSETEIYNRINLKPSIGITISKQSGSNAVEVAELVRRELRAIESDFSAQQVKFTVAQDSSEFTLEAANAVYKDFFIAIGLVALVMLVFLHSIRNSVIVMLAIPTSLVSAFIMMYFMDYSLNLMTLLAMSLVIGILVDDSIVVLENIYRHLEMGKDRVAASLDGRNEIGFSALSITLVDVVVFLPMALVPGLVGSLVREFSLVVVVSTLSSLLVSFTLTPMIASRFARLEHPSGKTFFGRLSLFFERQIDKLIHGYASVLNWALDNRWKTLLLTFVVFLSSFLLVTEGYVGSEFSPATDKGEMSLLLTMPPGTKLEETQQRVAQIERNLLQKAEVTRLFTNVGYQADGFNESRLPNVAQVDISLVPSGQRSKGIPELSREVKAIAMQVPGMKARVSPIGLLGANDAPIQVLAYGDNRDSVAKAASILLQKFKSMEGLVSPRFITEQGSPEVEVVVDRERMGRLGLNIETVGTALRTAINGYDDLKFRSKDDEVPIRILLQENNRNQTEKLLNLTFINSEGQVVYLDQFADIRLATRPSALERRNRSTSMLVVSQVVGIPVGEVGEELKAFVRDTKMPAGVKISFEGDLELQDDSFGSLGLALLTSIILIYLIMVALYNNWLYPFVVLFSLPVALVGALLALALAAKSLNIFTIFGLIMLMGLVAKNAILLVDRTNDVRAHGTPLKDALLDAGRTRLRPILMTTMAMVIGMLPLALAKGAGAELNSGLAWVLIGGLSSSMFLTLLVVPVIYHMVTRLAERFANRNKNTTRPQFKTGYAGVILATVLSISSGSTLAQSTLLELSADQAVEMGLRDNIQVKIARLGELASRHKRLEAGGNFLPSVTANGQYLRNVKPAVFFFPSFGASPDGTLTVDENNLQPIDASLKNQFSADITARLSLINMESIYGYKASRINEQLSAEQTRQVREKIATEIRKSYFQVQLSMASREFIVQSINRAEQALQETRSLYWKGMVVDADTLSAYVALENLRPDLMKVESNIQSGTIILKTLTGIDFNQPITLTTSLEEYAQRTFVSDTTGSVLARSDIRQLKLQEDASLLQLKGDRFRRLPVLSLVSAYQIQSQANDFKFDNYVWPNSFYVGAQISIPIFTGFQNHNRIQQSVISVRQASMQRLYLQRQAYAEIYSSLSNLQSAQMRIAAQQKTVQSAQRNYDQALSRYRKGMLKLSELNNASLTLNQSRNNYLQALYDYVASGADHLNNTGVAIDGVK